MKSILKFVMVSIGLALIVVGVLGVVFSEQAFSLFKDKLEAYASDILGAEVAITSVSFSEKHGGLMIHDFTVAHPPEFKEGEAIRCEKILLQPVWNTLFSPTPVFKKITVQNADISLRHEARNGTNIGTFIRNIRTALDEEPQDNAAPFPREIKVERIFFASGTLRVSSGIFPLPAIPLDINAFEVNNVDEGRPVPVGKLMGVMLRDLLLEALTLKGVLKPLEPLLMGEAEQL